MMNNINKVFNSLKRDKLIMDIFRYVIGSLLSVGGLILTILLGSYLYLVVGILLSMADSVIVIGFIVFDNKKKTIIKNHTLNDIIPNMEYKSSNQDITEIYNYFNYKNQLNHIDVVDCMIGNINNKRVISFSVRAKMSNKKYYLRLYKIEIDKDINIYNIKSELLNNFRYERVGNYLYISTISRKDNTFNPVSYKTYEDYKDRYYKELELLNSVIQMEE